VLVITSPSIFQRHLFLTDLLKSFRKPLGYPIRLHIVSYDNLNKITFLFREYVYQTVICTVRRWSPSEVLDKMKTKLQQLPRVSVVEQSNEISVNAEPYDQTGCGNSIKAASKPEVPFLS